MVLSIKSVVAPYYGTNCWILSSNARQECVVVDPGIGDQKFLHAIREQIDTLNHKVVAILITHGHIDHFFTVIPLQDDVGISQVLIHKSDRDLLTHPERALTKETAMLLNQLGRLIPGYEFRDPKELEEIDGDCEIELAGMKFEIRNTPGHTPGSIIASVEDQVLISGDTLFAGSIGRTDLPRGSISKMEESLREKILTLPGHLRVLPGHGPETRLETEFKVNQYLTAVAEGRSIF